MSKAWMDLSNALFSSGGILARAYPNAVDRNEFMKTPEYAAIVGAVADAMRFESLTRENETLGNAMEAGFRMYSRAAVAIEEILPGC